MDAIDRPLRYSRYQTARGALADSETRDALFLFKNASTLRLTYQIRLLAFRAAHEKKKLIVRIPKSCKIDRGLSNFLKEMGTAIRVERVQ